MDLVISDHQGQLFDVLGLQPAHRSRGALGLAHVFASTKGKGDAGFCPVGTRLVVTHHL